MTLLVSSSMKPAPRKNIWPLGLIERTGANVKRMAMESAAMMPMPTRFGRHGICRPFKYRNGQLSVGTRVIDAVSTTAGAILRHASLPVGAGSLGEYPSMPSLFDG